MIRDGQTRREEDNKVIAGSLGRHSAFNRELMAKSIVILVLLWGVMVGTPSYAHNMSVSFVEVTVEGSTARVKYRLPLAELDLLFMVDKNADNIYQPEEIEEARQQIEGYFREKLDLKINGRPVAAQPQDHAIWADQEDHLFVDFWQEIALQERIRQVAFSSGMFQELISDHKTLVLIHLEDRIYPFALDQSNPSAIWSREESASWAHFFRFLELGIEHIFSGYDHILFLIGILLLGSTLREVIKIVTSFTAAHSLTLALATLNIVNPNAQLVEVVIALSIAYIGMENLLQKHWTRAWHISFGFGLAHGFGFANVLKEMDLSSTQLATSLFSFNLGVEIGQVVIASLVFPLLVMLRRYPRRTWVIQSIAVFICAFGIFWFFDRVFAP